MREEFCFLSQTTIEIQIPKTAGLSLPVNRERSDEVDHRGQERVGDGFLAGRLLLQHAVQQELQAVLEVRQLDTAPTKKERARLKPTYYQTLILQLTSFIVYFCILHLGNHSENRSTISKKSWPSLDSQFLHIIVSGLHGHIV